MTGQNVFFAAEAFNFAIFGAKRPFITGRCSIIPKKKTNPEGLVAFFWNY